MKRLFGASLRVRLLVGTLLGVSAALLVAGLVLSNLFREQVARQFQAGLRVHLDQLTASVEPGAEGQPVLSAELADARWHKPYSGLYWQVDGLNTLDGPDGQVRKVVPALLRSRSLWDATLSVPDDVLADGEVHVHDTLGPDGARLRVMERAVRPAERPGTVWLLRVAQDTHELDTAVSSFVGVLVVSLGVLAAALMAAAVAQVAVGLAPLRSLQAAVSALRAGRLQRLESVQGNFPAELQPLVDDFNGVLDQNEQIVLRARTQAGNLAHAIKTAAGRAVQRRGAPRHAAGRAGPAGRRAGGAGAAAGELAPLARPRRGGSGRARRAHPRGERGRAAGEGDGPGPRRAPPRFRRPHRGLAAVLRGRGAGPAGNARQPARQRLQVGAVVGAWSRWRRWTAPRGPGCASPSRTTGPA